MSYKWQDAIVLILASVLRVRIRKLRQIAPYVTMLTRRLGRRSSGTSDKSPR